MRLKQDTEPFITNLDWKLSNRTASGRHLFSIHRRTTNWMRQTQTLGALEQSASSLVTRQKNHSQSGHVTDTASTGATIQFPPSVRQAIAICPIWREMPGQTHKKHIPLPAFHSILSRHGKGKRWLWRWKTFDLRRSVCLGCRRTGGLVGGNGNAEKISQWAQKDARESCSSTRDILSGICDISLSRISTGTHVHKWHFKTQSCAKHHRRAAIPM